MIFRRSILDQLRSGWGLLDEKYPSRGLDSVLSENFGETMLSEALVDVIVTSYDLEGRNPYFFKRRKARGDTHRGRLPYVAGRTRDGRRADLFRAAEGRDRRPHASLRPRGRGRVRQQPAMCGYAEAARFQRDHDLVLVSLGTGQRSDPIPYEKAKDWGLVNWPRPLLDVVFDGVSDATDYQLTQVMDDGRYFRLQTTLEEASGALDDASEQNLRALHREGQRQP